MAAMREADAALPRYVEQEFVALLGCGVLANGVARVRCDGCGFERLVAFSCKRRGVCASCGGRRMAETAARRVDGVLPDVGLRQWVLTVPWALRLPMARDPTLYTKARFSVLDDGRIAYRVKYPRSAKATHLVMTPMECMARLAALVPPPRVPLV